MFFLNLKPGAVAPRIGHIGKRSASPSVNRTVA